MDSNKIILKDFVLEKRNENNIYNILKDNVNIGQLSLKEDEDTIVVKQIEIKESYNQNYETEIANLLFNDYVKEKTICVALKNEKASEFWKNVHK